jgi:type II secretory pathway pseudopilin PulG
MSMIIVAVTLSIVAVMAAVTMPNLVTYHKQQDAELTAKVLWSLDSSMARWVRFVGQAPAALHILMLPVSTADFTCSGNHFKAKPVGQWSNFWPWTGVPVVPDYGVPTPMGFIHDSVLASAVHNGDTEIHIDSLDLDQVELLDIAVDDGDGDAAGFLRYAASSGSSAAHPLYLAMFHMAHGGCF